MASEKYRFHAVLFAAALALLVICHLAWRLTQ